MAQTRILRVFAAFLLPTQWTRGGIAARAHPRAPPTHYLLLSSTFSLLWKPTARCPRTTFSFLLPSHYFRVHSWFSPSQWTHGGTAARARPRAPSKHYLLLSSPFSLLSCPLVVLLLSLSCISYFSWFHPSLLLLNERVAEPPRGRAHARHPSTTLYLLLPSPYFGSPLHSDHALPSPFFSLLPTFVSISGSNCFVFFVFFVV